MVASNRHLYALSMSITFAVPHITYKSGKTFCQGVLGCRLPLLVTMPDVGAAKSNTTDMRHAELSHVAMDIAEDGNANVSHADMGDAAIGDHVHLVLK